MQNNTSPVHGFIPSQANSSTRRNLDHTVSGTISKPLHSAIYEAQEDAQWVQFGFQTTKYAQKARELAKSKEVELLYWSQVWHMYIGVSFHS